MKSTPRAFLIAILVALLTAPFVCGAAARPQPTSAREALLAFSWTWQGAKAVANGKQIRFDADGTVSAQWVPAGHWKWEEATNKMKRFRIVLPGGEKITYVFDDTFTSFSQLFDEEGHKPALRGTRSSPREVAAPTPATVKAAPSTLEIIKEQSPNVTAWITGPLDNPVPPAIWENMTFLKEALRDEAAEHPTATKPAYELGVKLCNLMIGYLEERNQATVRAGGAAVLHQKSSLSKKQRDHLTWPQYFLEKDERSERKKEAKKAPRFQSGQAGVLWNVRTQQIRPELSAGYASFREALRQPFPEK